MTAPNVLQARRLSVWVAFIVVIGVAPLLSSRGFVLSLLSQIGIMTVFATSFNLLLGHTGLLSFGHAVYFGTGSFFTIHALNAYGRANVPLPVTLLPLVGGLAALVLAAALGAVTTGRAGTTFAMISLGIGELVASSSLMFPGFFGGEGGVSGNRVTGRGWLGIDYGSQLQMYYLIAAWALLCMVAMFSIVQTPLGRMANAVRDNPERAQFIGYNPQRVRYLMVVLSGFFAGIAGGLSALTYEIVTAETLHVGTSSSVILMAFVGGTGFFFGPAIGAALITLLQSVVSGFTEAWLFYFGLFFLAVVLYAPGGLAGIAVGQWRLFRAGLLARLLPGYLSIAGPVALLACGLVAVVEMAYRLLSSREAPPLRWHGLSLEPERISSWALALLALLAGVVLLRLAWRRSSERWSEAQTALAGEGQ